MPLAALEPSAQLPGGGAISGIVVKAGTNDPVMGAVVELRPAAAVRGIGAVNVTASPCLRRTVEAEYVTNSDGRFEFRNLESGSYCISARYPDGSYVRTEYLQRGGWRGPGVDVVVGPNGPLQDLRVEMTPTGSISGRVFHDNGRPAPYARVAAFESDYRSGERRLIIISSTHTDDRGQYRLPWLPPGRYYVSALPEDPRQREIRHNLTLPGHTDNFRISSAPFVIRRNLENGEVIKETFIPTWYGGTTDASRAQAIDLAPGIHLSTADIPTGIGRTPAFHVRGVAIDGVSGQGVPNASIQLLPQAFVSDPIVPVATANEAGVFEIEGVAPGSYVLYALGERDRSSGLIVRPSGRVLITVGSGDFDGVRVTILPLFDLDVQVLIEGGQPAAIFESGAAGQRGQQTPAGQQFLRFSIGTDPDTIGTPHDAPGGPVYNRPIANGTFAYSNLGPGRYRIYIDPLLPYHNSIPSPLPPLLQTAYIRSMRMGDMDVLNDGLTISAVPSMPLEIRIAMDGGSIEGTVADGNRTPVVNAAVVLIPDSGLEHRRDLFKSTWSDISGRFSLDGIAPGTYWLYAWEDVPEGIWHDPNFCQNYAFDSRRAPVQVGSNSENRIELTIIPVR